MKRPPLSKSSLMAVGLAAAVAVWMLTGLVGARTPSATDSAGPTQRVDSTARDGGLRFSSDADAPQSPGSGVRVSVRQSTAQPVVRDVVASGRTEPNRIVELKAETEGRVVGLGADRGTPVRRGETIAKLDVRDREARIEEAEAIIAQNELQYQAAKRLEGQQLIAEAQIAEAYARLIGARATLEDIRLDLAHTTITAPFDGMLRERDVEIGDYVGVGDPIAEVVDNDPLIAVAELNEREIGTISLGSIGRAQLIDGRVVEGEVRYISPVADPSTRTFRIELAVANPDSKLPAGMTARVRLPATEVDAHFLSPALLTLDDEGNVGVKIVSPDHRVEFHPVAIVKSASDGVWVTGLPPEATVITVGQGFVATGDQVQPVRE